jgi:hypothetical protein
MFTTGTVIAFVAGLATIGMACAPVVPEARLAKRQVTRHPGYSEIGARLTALDRKAEVLFRAHKQDEAAALIHQGEHLAKQLLSVPRPSLEATEAGSDPDDLYARMLLSKSALWLGKAAVSKNVARWRY